MIEEQVYTILILLLLVIIIGGSIASWFKFMNTIESDTEYRNAIKMAHRIAGSSQCLAYVSESFSSRKNIIDGNKLKLSTELYGDKQEEGTLFLGLLNIFNEKETNTPREHPCAFLSGYEWQIHVRDLEFFPNLPKEKREELAKHYKCQLVEDECLWSFGKQFKYKPRLELSKARKAWEEKLDRRCIVFSSMCKDLANKIATCFDKLKDESSIKETLPATIPVGITLVNDEGQEETHTAILESVVIPSQEVCNQENVDPKRVLFLFENSAIRGKNCCYYDLQEGVCQGNLLWAKRQLGMATRYVYGITGGLFYTWGTGYCPNIEDAIEKDNFHCSCKNRGQPVEIMAMQTTQQLKMGCKDKNFIFVRAQNRNWEHNATIEHIVLSVDGIETTLCTKENCDFPEKTVFIDHPKKIPPRSIGSYVFSIDAEELSNKDMEMEAIITYTIKKLPSPYYTPEEVCTDIGGEYRCRHTMKTNIKGKKCVETECDNCCLGMSCPDDYYCCSIGGCMSESLKWQCKSDASGWDQVLQVGEQLV